MINIDISQDILFCDVYGNTCFDQNMKNSTNQRNCDCPMECNSISYSFRVVSTKLEEDEVCEGKDSFMKEFYAHKIPPQFERKLIEIKNNVSSDEIEYCKRNLQYRAMVIFRLATGQWQLTPCLSLS